MSFTFEKMVAGRYLRSKRREGFISVIAGFSFLGIMLGVATLIIVMSVMNGFRAELVGRILGLNGHINIYSQSGAISDYNPLIKNIKKIKDVVKVTASVEGQALLSVKGAASGVIIRGMTKKDFANKDILANSFINKISDNEYFRENLISIGISMARRFNLQTGDKIVLIAPKGKVTPFGTMPRSASFIIGSIFDVGMYEYNNAYIFMPLKIAQDFFTMGHNISSIEIVTKNPEKLFNIKLNIRDFLGYGYRVTDWKGNNAGFYNAIKVETNVMFLILTLIIIVAAFNIISSLIMLVKDKGQDIAILRTMGATRGMIIRIFFYTGAAIGTFGTLAGAGLGIIFCINIEKIRSWLESLTGTNLFSDEVYFLTKLPSKMEVNEVITIILMALALSFAATIYPAWRAAKLDPVEGLRGE